MAKRTLSKASTAKNVIVVVFFLDYIEILSVPAKVAVTKLATLYELIKFFFFHFFPNVEAFDLL